MAQTFIGYENGKHVWEVTWTGQLGTVAMIGVSSRDKRYFSRSYQLRWGVKESWCWNLINNSLWHNEKSYYGKYPLLHNAPKYKTGEKLQLVLDCDKRFMYFKKNNEFLGIAFYNLPKTKLYPTVVVDNQALSGDPKISLVYIGNPLSR